MKRFSILGILVLLVSLFSFSPVEASAVYSINMVKHANVTNAYNTPCVDDTCDEGEILYYVDFDVTERPDAVAVDICIFGDSDVSFYSATITSTGSLYTGSYINDNTWNCGASNGTLGTVTTGTGWKCGVVVSDMIFCKLRIDENSNARITLTGKTQAPQTECMEADHVTSSPPGYNRFFQSDIYKHSDTTKSGTDSDTLVVPCIDGNGQVNIERVYEVFYNGATYYKPTATPYKFLSYRLDDSGATTGPITYDVAMQLPTWMAVTSCNITNSGTWYSPYNPPTCNITNSGRTITTTLKFGADIFSRIELTGTIGSIPECPSLSTFNKDVLTDNFITRHSDGSWLEWDNLVQPFKCQ